MSDKKERIELRPGHTSYLKNGIDLRPHYASDVLIEHVRAKCTTIPALLAVVDNLIKRHSTLPHVGLAKDPSIITWTRGDESDWGPTYRAIYDRAVDLWQPGMTEPPQLENDAYPGMVAIKVWLKMNLQVKQPPVRSESLQLPAVEPETIRIPTAEDIDWTIERIGALQTELRGILEDGNPDPHTRMREAGKKARDEITIYLSPYREYLQPELRHVADKWIIFWRMVGEGQPARLDQWVAAFKMVKRRLLAGSDTQCAATTPAPQPKAPEQVTPRNSPELDAVDNTIIQTYQTWEQAQAEGKKIRRPSYAKIAKAIARSPDLPDVDHITAQAVGKRVAKLMKAGLVPKYEKKRKESICAPEHIADLEADGQARKRF